MTSSPLNSSGLSCAFSLLRTELSTYRLRQARQLPFKLVLLHVVAMQHAAGVAVDCKTAEPGRYPKSAVRFA